MLVRSQFDLQNEVLSQVSRGDFNTALFLIHKAVEQILLEPINTARIFSSQLLDELCQHVGAVNWETLSKRLPAKAEQYRTIPDRPMVYVVSQLYISGGHTAALADIIRLGPSSTCVILVTGVTGATDRSNILHRFDSIENLSFEYAPKGNHKTKLDWLQKRLWELSPGVVWLFNHHQDSVAVAGVQPGSGYQLRYYHHADHHLCLGVHLNFAEHVDISPAGFHNCREKLGIQENRYLPLVAKDFGISSKTSDSFAASGLVTCTAASSIKVESPYYISYVDVIPQLLRASGGKHIHIGHLTPIALARIRWGIYKLGLPRNSFLYLPFVRSVWKALHEHKVNLYVASFPYGGARTLIEVMGAGVAPILHMHYSSRLLSAFDIAYEGVPTWKSPQDLYAYVRGVNGSELKSQGKIARDVYEKFYREDLMSDALSNWNSPLKAPPLKEGYLSNDFQEALDIASQTNYLGATSRLFKRTLRKWKLLRM